MCDQCRRVHEASSKIADGLTGLKGLNESALATVLAFYAIYRDKDTVQELISACVECFCSLDVEVAEK
jgi:hypothetical protein